MDINIDLIFYLFGDMPDEIIDDVLAVICQGITGIVLLSALFQPACLHKFRQILLYGKIIHIIFCQQKLTDFAVGEGNAHFLQEMQDDEFMLC